MKVFGKILAIALFAAAAAAAAACNGTGPKHGEPFNELPLLEKSDILAFFQALPAEDLPAKIATAEARERYYKSFREMTEYGMLADGEGPEQTTPKTENAVFWSDYLDAQGDYEPSGDESEPHPYANIYVYSGTEAGTQFGIVKSGAYIDGEDKANPLKCYWFDAASGKLTPAKLSLNPKYTEDDITADPLLTYGSDNLYYAIKNKKFSENYFDSGMSVYLEDVGKTGVLYEWNGVEFVRDTSKPLYCIYNYAFANICLGDKVPYSVPGYSTMLISSTEYESTHYLVKSGESEPTLVMISGMDDELVVIQVCKGPYCNPYGIYPGMPVEDFKILVNGIGYDYFEGEAFYCSDAADDFVNIYCRFDEDFFYMVPKSQYLGNNEFAPGAKIARVAIISAVG